MDHWNEVRAALAGQYYAGFKMLRQCIEVCPDDLWNEAPWPRSFWRIAYHALFYAHFYMQPSHNNVNLWDKQDLEAVALWEDDDENRPRKTEPYTKEELLAYVDHIIGVTEETLAKVDLGSQDSGFPWYPIPKIDHEMLSVRHLQGHVGQLSELLMMRGIDIDWVSTHPSRRLPEKPEA
ncbi:hypothetical protein [Fimbriimonas ginsengisoli]|uniref:DinB-like domain-containing protein n=1 Tax=Fimbriimonas ginsengisoli Gsoil 348 TaxID=661478 RepID=A0A068NYC1_FIMGI|nr:hypothetical protein [Fimbriimonas ginsengisoli]AIE86839.1 hypothetical protein OP10G_3471 [Fimbriimonas ginsengisoli Gsoil 348]